MHNRPGGQSPIGHDVEDVTPPGRPRSDSVNKQQPPPPPADFNPPAEPPPVSPVESITPPDSAPLSGSDSLMSISQQLEEESSEAIASAIAAAVARRPSLRSVQRVSSESVATPRSRDSSISIASDGSRSDGKEHLVEAREELLHRTEGIYRTDSTERTRRDSSSAGTSGQSPVSFDFNVINPTPPQHPSELENESPEVGPSRPRASITPPPLAPGQGSDAEMSPEHAWDSVWPAAGVVNRPAVSTEPVRPHFPTAPISPFVTPDFSPAVIPTVSTRRPLSPGDPEPLTPLGHVQSPVQLLASRGGGGRSPTLSAFPDNFDFGRRRSIPALSSLGSLLSHSPPTAPSVAIHHRRSQSGSSPNTYSRPLPNVGAERFSFPSSSSPVYTARATTETIEEEEQDSAPGPSRTSPDPPPPRRQQQPAGLISPSFISRPRGKSMSSIRPSPPPNIDEGSTRQSQPRRSPAPVQLPPISLPPPVAPGVFTTDGEEGVIVRNDALASLSSPPVIPPPSLFSPLTRPGVLRRALSDYDQTKARPGPPPLLRSVSTTPELDKSPKYSLPTSSDTSSPPVGPEETPTNKSPVVSAEDAQASTLSVNTRPAEPSPLAAPPELQESQPDFAPADHVPTPGVFPHGEADHMGEVSLVDEGDVLPSSDMPMDVTFDDEGLNTLERIFLLSNSDFPFHRAYVARVLGDLLAEVDPCESVEYVLPLLSGFSMDEDESVKEAFASELHRILWYFFSTCVLLDQEGEQVATEEIGGIEVNPATETVTVTSEGLDVVPTPTDDDIANVPTVGASATPAESSRSGASALAGVRGVGSGGSTDDGPKEQSSSDGSYATSTTYVDTPSSQNTAYSPSSFVNPFAEGSSSNAQDPTKGMGPLVPLPPLAVNFFTPLIGSLLLSQNPVIAESVRDCLVHIVCRLRGKEAAAPDIWGMGAQTPQKHERKSFQSQTGPHCHDMRPFDATSRALVESEILEGIVIGMGHLSTEMPEGLFDSSMDPEANQAELFQEQLIAEAAAGRATSMNLVGSLCEFYSADEVVEYGLVDEVLRSGEGDVSVRAEGAVALSCLAKIAPIDSVYHMIPLFEMFVADEAEHVRQSVCLSLPAICKRIDDVEYRRAFAVNAVKSLAVHPDDVRCAMLEMLGEVIWIFKDDPDGPPLELLEVYTEDITTYEILDTDWDVVAAFNFPGVALTLGADRWNELRTLYVRLQHRAGPKIQRILAASLHELAKILRPDQVEDDILPVYRKCLTLSDEIRERVYENVDIIVKRVDPTVGWYLFGDLAQAWRDGTLGGWRAREQLALHLPSFLETFRETEQGLVILDTVRDALLDPFAAVRDAVCQKIPATYVVLGDDSPVSAKYRDLLLELGQSSKYRQRLTFSRCLREFIKPPPNRNAFEDFFVPALPRLAHDVVDIRLSLAQTIADLFVVGAYYGAETGPVPGVIFELARTLLDDEAVDVRDTLRNVDLKRLHHGMGVPHAVQPTRAPDRAALPGDVSSVSKTSSEENVAGQKAQEEEEVSKRLEEIRLEHEASGQSHSSPDEPNIFAASFLKHSPPADTDADTDGAGAGADA